MPSSLHHCFIYQTQFVMILQGNNKFLSAICKVFKDQLKVQYWVYILLQECGIIYFVCHKLRVHVRLSEFPSFLKDTLILILVNPWLRAQLVNHLECWYNGYYILCTKTETILLNWDNPNTTVDYWFGTEGVRDKVRAAVCEELSFHTSPKVYHQKTWA